MKTLTIHLLLMCCLAVTSVQSAGQASFEVDTAPGFEKLFMYEQYYISGQPDMEMLRWLREQDVTQIINLRTAEEIEEHNSQAFPEADSALMLGFKYLTLPIDSKKGFNPANQALFNELADTEARTFVHCKSGGRATYLLMGYLVTMEGFNVEEALRVGRQMIFMFPLEELLGTELDIR